ARGPPRCAPAGGSPPPAVRPAPANLARVPRAAPDARPDARSALHTAPRARLPALHPRTPAPSPSPCRTALRAPCPTTAATAVLHLRLSFRPSSWHSCSWRPPPLTQPDFPIGRGMPPLNSQQPSGHRQGSVSDELLEQPLTMPRSNTNHRRRCIANLKESQTKHSFSSTPVECSLRRPSPALTHRTLCLT